MPQVVSPASLCLRLHRVNGVLSPHDGVASVVVPAEGLDIGSAVPAEGFRLDAGLYVAPLHASIRPDTGNSPEHGSDNRGGPGTTSHAVRYGWQFETRDPRVISVLNGHKLVCGERLPLEPGDIIEVGFAALLVEEIPRKPDDFAREPDVFGRMLHDSTRAPDVFSSAPEAFLPLSLAPPSSELASELASEQAENAPESGQSLSLPASPGNAEALVSLLEQDCNLSDAERFLRDPLEGILGTVEPSPPDPDDEDILSQLARESEQVLRDPTFRDSGTSRALQSSPATFYDACASQDSTTFRDAHDPLDPLAPWMSDEEPSLDALLEGPLSIDDVLERLGEPRQTAPLMHFGQNFPELLAPEPPPPDPLLLLAGETAHRIASTIADSTNRDYRSLGIGTPYRQRGAASSGVSTTPSQPFPPAQDTHREDS